MTHYFYNKQLLDDELNDEYVYDYIREPYCVGIATVFENDKKYYYAYSIDERGRIELNHGFTHKDDALDKAKTWLYGLSGALSTEPVVNDVPEVTEYKDVELEKSIKRVFKNIHDFRDKAEEMKNFIPSSDIDLSIQYLKLNSLAPQPISFNIGHSVEQSFYDFIDMVDVSEIYEEINRILTRASNHFSSKPYHGKLHFDATICSKATKEGIIHYVRGEKIHINLYDDQFFLPSNATMLVNFDAASQLTNELNKLQNFYGKVATFRKDDNATGSSDF